MRVTKDVGNESGMPLLSDPARPRSIFRRVFGRWGLVWAVAVTALATVLRWTTDNVLHDSAPFSFYYLSVVLTALVAPIGSSIVAMLLGGLCAHFLWVEPRFSLHFLNTAQIAQFVVYFFVATLCTFSVMAARFLRFLDYFVAGDD